MPFAASPPAANAAPRYRRREPETTALYEVVRDNLETLYGAIDDGALAVRIPKHARKELVRITLKRAYADGTVAVDLDPLSLLCRLATSVPPPRFHTVKDAGVLAPASRWRARLAPTPPIDPAASADEPTPARRVAGYRPWAELLARTFAVDVLTCSRCHGRMRLLALVSDPTSVARYLAATGEATELPRRSPGRGPPYWKILILRRKTLGEQRSARSRRIGAWQRTQSRRRVAYRSRIGRQRVGGGVTTSVRLWREPGLFNLRALRAMSSSLNAMSRALFREPEPLVGPLPRAHRVKRKLDGIRRRSSAQPRSSRSAALLVHSGGSIVSKSRPRDGLCLSPL